MNTQKLAKSYLALLFGIFSLSLHAQTQLPELGKTPSPIEVSGKDGGSVADGSAWKSEDIKGHPWFMVYVDPDESTLNDELTEALKNEGFHKAFYNSVAIINLAATWKPNSIINMLLRSKQKEFPDTTYVNDNNKKLVKDWKLGDDTFDTVYFDKNNKVLYRKTGKFSKKEIKEIIALIKKNAPKGAKPKLVK